MPRTTARPIDGPLLLLTAVIVAFLLYASLYPFHFHDRSGSALEALLRTWKLGTSRSDFLANILFYAPLGFCAARVFRRASMPARVLLGAATGGALALTVELAQFYDASRVSSMFDIYANTLGALLGGVSAAGLGRVRYALPKSVDNRRPFALLMLGLWLGWRLFPYVPTVDLSKYKRAIKPLLFSPTLAAPSLVRHFAVALAIAALLEEVAGARMSRLAAPVLIVGVICARVAIAGAVLSPAEVVGGVAAVVCWAILLSYLPFRLPLTAAVFLGAVTLASLEPFHFVAAARPFGWIPFEGFLHGSMAVNTASLLEKAFIYGVLIWLIHRSGCPLAVTTAATAAFVLLLRLCQLYLPDRSAEVTDAVMVVLMGCLFAMLRREAVVSGRLPRISSSA